MSRPLPHDGDQLPTELGRKIEPPAPPKPTFTPTETPGVYKGPDGKFITAIPENERARWAPSKAALEVDYSDVELRVAALLKDLLEETPTQRAAIDRFYRGEFNVEGTRTGRLPASSTYTSATPKADLTEAALEDCVKKISEEMVERGMRIRMEPTWAWKPTPRYLAVGDSCRQEDIEDRLVTIPYDAVVTYDPVTHRTTRIS